MEVRFSKTAIKAMHRMDAATWNRIVNGIIGLTQAPPVGDIKPLSGMEGVFRLRIGEYRVLYIGSRGGIYK